MQKTPLASGGMGSVSIETQPSLGREVAVKRAPPQFQPFLVREAQLTSHLEHPNILPIYEMVQDEDGGAAVRMRLIRGQTWAQKIDSLGLEANLKILLQVCNAVAYAHARQVMHGYLKPDNVMVGEFGEVTLLDWGLAAALVPSDQPSPGRRSPGKLGHTRLYGAGNVGKTGGGGWPALARCSRCRHRRVSTRGHPLPHPFREPRLPGGSCAGAALGGVARGAAAPAGSSGPGRSGSKSDAAAGRESLRASVGLSRSGRRLDEGPPGRGGALGALSSRGGGPLGRDDGGSRRASAAPGAAEVQRERRLALAMDPQRDPGGRRLLMLAVGTTWTAMPLLIWAAEARLGENVVYPAMMILEDGLLLVLAVAGAVLWPRIRQSQVNRDALVVAGTTLGCQFLLDLSFWVQGFPPHAALAQHLLLWAMAGAYQSLYHPRLLPLVPVFGAGWLVAIVWPSTVYAVLALSSGLLTVGIAWVWREERRDS
jgi:serine/threonine protein kinase